VGESGTILHYDGASWSAMTSGATDTIRGVWGSSGSDVFAVCGTTVLHYSGSTSTTTTADPVTTTTIESTTTTIDSITTTIPKDTTTTTIESTTTSTGDFSTTTTIDGKITTTTVPAGPCPAQAALGADNPKIENLRAFRDSSLAQSAVGRRIIKIYYINAASINAALERSPALQAAARRVLEVITPMAGKN
jgi:hypothetical protein